MWFLLCTSCDYRDQEVNTPIFDSDLITTGKVPMEILKNISSIESDCSNNMRDDNCDESKKSLFVTIVSVESSQQKNSKHILH